MIPLGQLRAGTLLDGDEAGGARRGRRRRDVARRARAGLPSHAHAPDRRPRLRLMYLTIINITNYHIIISN